MKLYDEFSTKTQAQRQADDLRKQGIQYVRVRKSGSKYQVYIGGRNSSMY